MRHATNQLMLAILVVVLGVAATSSRAQAQEPPDELTPRAIADSTYGVRVALSFLTESIRNGNLHRRQGEDPELSVSVTRLVAVAARRPRPRPHPDLGVLWDLQMEVAEFQAVTPVILRAQVRVFLSTGGDSVGAPVTLTFRRNADRWELFAYERLVERLDQIALRLAGGMRQ